MQEIFTELTRPFWKKPRFWFFMTLFLIFAVYLVFFVKGYFKGGLSEEELRTSVEFTQISSQWIEKEKIEDRDFKGIVMVPQVSFRIRNVGEKTIQNIYILGVFRKLYVGKSMGEGFKVILKKGIRPGETSGEIVLNSQFGYRTSSKAGFKSSSAEWGKSLVEIYIKSSSSKLFFIKSFYIRQVIEGMSKDVFIK